MFPIKSKLRSALQRWRRWRRVDGPGGRGGRGTRRAGRRWRSGREGKNVLITGSNRGIGLALVKRFVEDGFYIYACCRQPEKATALTQYAEIYEGNIEIIACDVSNKEQVFRIADLIKTPIDILINNAGIIGQDESGIENNLSIDLWLEAFRVNSISPVVMTQAFLPHLKRGQLKRIINISSSLGSISQNEMGGLYPYRASKAALNCMTKNLAVDLESMGMTVVALHPGWVKTDMGGPQGDLTPEESANHLKSLILSLTCDQNGAYMSYTGDIMLW